MKDIPMSMSFYSTSIPDHIIKTYSAIIERAFLMRIRSIEYPNHSFRKRNGGNF